MTEVRAAIAPPQENPTRPLEATDLPEMPGIASGIRNGRSVRDGYVRGWGLEFGELAARIRADPLYREACALAEARTVVSELRRMNLFLLLKFYLPRLPRGHIIEFGAYKAGNAVFMAHIAREVMPGTRVFALDTFKGMPPTDRSIDAHSGGDFGDASLDEVRRYVEERGLENLTLAPGRFEDTASELVARHGPFVLAHVDCDIHSAVACAYESVKGAMVPGGYVVFDDATTSSCIGATDVVEQMVIRRDGRSSEQIYPHFVFRV